MALAKRGDIVTYNVARPWQNAATFLHATRTHKKSFSETFFVSRTQNLYPPQMFCALQNESAFGWLFSWFNKFARYHTLPLSVYKLVIYYSCRSWHWSWRGNPESGWDYCSKEKHAHTVWVHISTLLFFIVFKCYNHQFQWGRFINWLHLFPGRTIYFTFVIKTR